jgi:cellulose 1,4-beta-cellobiosidase
MNHVDPLGSLAGLMVSGGRLNVNNAILNCGVVPDPPAAPTGLVATGGVGQISLIWNASTGASSYNVKRSSTSGGPYTTIGTGVSTTNYTDDRLAAGATFHYVVSAVNVAGESGNSAQASATVLGDGSSVPAPPTNLQGQGGNGQVGLTWQASSGATSYRVKRSLLKAGPFVQIAEVPGTSHTDLTVVNGTKYFYVVTAVNSAGESGASNKVKVIPGIVPATPTGVVAVTGSATGTINLSWNASSGATSYRIRRSGVSGGPYKNGKQTTATSFTATGLTSGKTYYFVVSALNATGESAPSPEASAPAK